MAGNEGELRLSAPGELPGPVGIRNTCKSAIPVGSPLYDGFLVKERRQHRI